MKDLREFRENHACLAELFEVESGYLFSSKEKKWLQFIQKNKHLTHKVKIKGEVFIVTSKEITLDTEKLYIVTFTNISTIEKQKEFYESIINSLENMLFIKDSEFKYTACNKEFEKFIGKNAIDIIGKSDYALFDKATADFFRAQDIAMLRKNENSRSNYEWVTYPNGEKVYLYTTKSRLVNAKREYIGIVGNAVNVTEGYYLEEELRAQRLEFEAFMDNFPGMAVLKDENFSILYANKAFNRFHKKESTVGLNDFHLFPKEQASLIRKIDSHALKEGATEEEITMEGSTYKTINFPVSYKDKRYLGSFVIDTTHEYNIKQQLMESERRLKKSQSIADIGHWEYDLKTEKVTWSDELYRIKGVDTTFIPTYESIFSFIHPEDKEMVNTYYDNVRKNKKNFRFIYRILREGETRYIEERGELSLDENNEIQKVLGTDQDITDSYKTQSELKKLKIAIEHVPMSILITDSQGNLEYCNPWFEKTSGYGFEEILKSRPNILRYDLTDKEEFESMWSTLNNGHIWRGTFHNRKKRR